VAYDAELADRIREILATTPDVSERKMFGGLAFLIDGHIAIAASSEGGLLVRVDPATTDSLIARETACVFVMGGRPMTGWVRVEANAVRTARQLSRWVLRSVDYASDLLPKRRHRGVDPRDRGR
jgi:TfoX/Sxy family transcriptional regulator of competence genes